MVLVCSGLHAGLTARNTESLLGASPPFHGAPGQARRLQQPAGPAILAGMGVIVQLASRLYATLSTARTAIISQMCRPVNLAEAFMARPKPVRVCTPNLHGRDAQDLALATWIDHLRLDNQPFVRAR